MASPATRPVAGASSDTPPSAADIASSPTTSSTLASRLQIWNLSPTKENQKLLRKAQKAALKQKQLNEVERKRISQQKQSDCSERIFQWKDEILPYWNATMKESARVRDLCWKGIPSNLREQIWPLLIGK